MVPAGRGGGRGRHSKTGPDGAALFRTKGCSACHTIDGTAGAGPTLKGIFGRTTTVVTGGRERMVLSDRTYIIRSLLEPQADVVKGFPPIMQSQRGQLTDDEINAVIDYLKTVK